MTVDQRRFQSLSRLGALEHVQGIEDRLLQNREQREFMQQKIRARAAGAEITKALTGLDPRAPDYLEQRNRILVSNPDAILDPRTKDLVGLYDEVYATTDERRKRGEGAIINQNENIRQENAAVTKDVLKMEGGKKTARETKDDEFYDSLDPTSRGFAQDRLGVYEVASVEELPEGKKEQFRREVRDFDNNQKVEVALIEGGFPPDALDGMKKASPTGYLEPIQVAKANAALAKRNSEATRIQKKIDAVDKRIQTLEDQSNPGAAERIR
ncbi:MAG: hypothetical protein Q8R28_20685, partial [Dehalococcoidia bacterium]|nr:hypothetical protein [Dehalococcoidia bacterium]